MEREVCDAEEETGGRKWPPVKRINSLTSGRGCI